jgi:hypothetical protein
MQDTSLTPEMQKAFTGFLPAQYPSVAARLNEWGPKIVQESKADDIDPRVVAAVLETEHGLIMDDHKMTPNYDKEGNILSTDRGGAQINDKAHPDVTTEEAWDPDYAIKWEAKYLSDKVHRIGYEDAIKAYNIGEGGLNNPRLYATGVRYANAVKNNLSPSLNKQLGL